jgi:hypothetical protein
MTDNWQTKFALVEEPKRRTVISFKKPLFDYNEAMNEDCCICKEDTSGKFGVFIVGEGLYCSKCYDKTKPP